MSTLSLRKLLLLVIVFAAAIGASAQQRAPNFSFKDINGKTIRLSDFKGKVVLLNFWATWCVPCRTEIPDLVKKQRRYRARGLRIVGITYPPEQESEVRRFTKKLKMNYPVIIGTKETKQIFTASETLPLTIIIDREGNIRELIEGIMYSDEFGEKVKPLLSGNGDRATDFAAESASTTSGGLAHQESTLRQRALFTSIMRSVSAQAWGCPAIGSAILAHNKSCLTASGRAA